jgi:hypothetical protein
VVVVTVPVVTQAMVADVADVEAGGALEIATVGAATAIVQETVASVAPPALETRTTTE